MADAKTVATVNQMDRFGAGQELPPGFLAQVDQDGKLVLPTESGNDGRGQRKL